MVHILSIQKSGNDVSKANFSPLDPLIPQFSFLWPSHTPVSIPLTLSYLSFHPFDPLMPQFPSLWPSHTPVSILFTHSYPHFSSFDVHVHVPLIPKFHSLWPDSSHTSFSIPLSTLEFPIPCEYFTLLPSFWPDWTDKWWHLVLYALLLNCKHLISLLQLFYKCGHVTHTLLNKLFLLNHLIWRMAH